MRWVHEPGQRLEALRWVAHKKDEDPDSFCCDQVMLFIPWTETLEDLREDATWPDIFCHS